MQELLSPSPRSPSSNPPPPSIHHPLLCFDRASREPVAVYCSLSSPPPSPPLDVLLFTNGWPGLAFQPTKYEARIYMQYMASTQTNSDRQLASLRALARQGSVRHSFAFPSVHPGPAELSSAQPSLPPPGQKLQRKKANAIYPTRREKQITLVIGLRPASHIGLPSRWLAALSRPRLPPPPQSCLLPPPFP